MLVIKKLPPADPKQAGARRDGSGVGLMIRLVGGKQLTRFQFVYYPILNVVKSPIIAVSIHGWVLAH